MNGPDDPLRKWILPAEPATAGELRFNGLGGFYDQVSMLTAKLPYVEQLGAQMYLVEFRFRSSTPALPAPADIQFVGDLETLSNVAVILDDLISQLEDAG